jgi:hypothetical protein
VTIKQAGISNRETPEEEQQEREQLHRPDDVGRDQAGHLVSESPAERIEADDDASRPKPDARAGDQRRDVRQSRAGG